MSDLTWNTRDDLIDMLKGVRYKLEQCAELDQRLSHARHRSDYYTDLLNRVDALVDTEQALNKRIQTVGR